MNNYCSQFLLPRYSRCHHLGRTRSKPKMSELWVGRQRVSMANYTIEQ